MCRMAIMFSLVERTMLGDVVRYLEHLHTVRGSVSSDTRSKRFPWKMSLFEVLTRIFWTFKNMKKTHFFTFIWKFSVAFPSTGVSALWSPDVGAPSRYFAHVSPTFRKFSSGLWSQNIRQKPPKTRQNPLVNFEISAWFHKKSRFHCFSFNKKWLRHRMITKVSAL